MNEIFGEMSFLEESPHTANVAAMEETEIVVISKQRFEELADCTAEERPITYHEESPSSLLRLS